MILDGHNVAQHIQKAIKKSIEECTSRPPCLACVITTDNPASVTYVKRKVKACEHVGIISQVIDFRPQSSKELISVLRKLNKEATVDGILVQLPLPEWILPTEIFAEICPTKDVDGFHPIHIGKVLLGDPNTVYPCTPLGIKVLLDHYNIPVASKRVLILGRSNIVGKPLAAILMQNSPGCNATVTIAHRYTEGIPDLCREADILIAAMGDPGYVTADMVHEHTVVIDVGVSRMKDPSTKSGFRIVGDVDFEKVSKKCAAITPVPGGVGPMTIAMLLQNTLERYHLHI